MSVNGDWICIINELFFFLHPTKIRFGVGVGNITTQIQKMNIQEMDGPAFHLARKAIEQLAKEKAMPHHSTDMGLRAIGNHDMRPIYRMDMV